MPGRTAVLTTDRATRVMANEAIQGIIDANDPPTLFARTGDNVQISRNGSQLQIMDKALATRLGEDHVDWYRHKNKADVPCAMPGFVAEHMLAHAPWEGLPPLTRVIHSPVILPDARVLDRTGYDPETGLYLVLEPGFALPSYPAEPTEDDMLSAFRLLDSYADEFIFASPADKANALVMQTSHLMRSFIGEQALLPLFALDAPMRATGKTTLGQTCGWLALGTEPMIAGQITRDEEWPKQIASTLLHETEILMFDNLDVPLSDPTLAALLTAEGEWGGRLLGGNNLVNARNKTTFIVTGNNLEVGPDLQRRTVYIRMDANMADPSRRQFRRTDFRGAMLADRPRLLAAFFTWVRRWLQLGSPVSGAPVMASYNPFVRAAHGLLSLVGIDQFLGNLTSFRESQDVEEATWARWLSEWFRLWGAEAQETGGLARVLDMPQDDQRVFAEIRPQELSVYSDVDRKKLPQTLGVVLKKRIDQIFGGFKLVRASMKDGYTRWRVIPLDTIEADPPSTQEEPSTPPAESVGSVGLVGSGTLPGPTYEKTEKVSARAKQSESPTSPTSPTENSGGMHGRARTRIHEAWQLGSRSFLARARAQCSIDTETTGLTWWGADKAEVRIITLATADRVIWADIRETPEALEDFKAAVADGLSPSMHNAVFDLGMLRSAGVPLATKFFDTFLASQLLDAAADEAQPQSLEALADRYLGVTLNKSYQAGPWDGELTPEQIEYACQDAAVTYDLAEVLQERITQEGMQQALDIEHGFVPFMLALKENGLPCDIDAWLDLEKYAIAERLRLEARMAELYGGTAPEKWTQKGWLEDYLTEHNWVSARTSRGKPSLNKQVIEELAQTTRDPLLETYVAWKPHEKRGSTWGEKFLSEHLAEDRRFHGEYWQLGTRTGRLSCDKPNMQNIPRGPYREALRPKEGRCFIKADYSQLQLVIIADVTLDPIMLAAYDPSVPHDKRPDLHTITARSVLGQHIPEGDKVRGAHRVVAKGINFGLCYGMGATKLAGMIEREMHEPCDLEVAKMRKFKYFQTYQGVKHWHGLRKHLSARGQSYDDDEYPNPIDVRSPSGRRRSGVREFTMKVNSPIQMCEADGVKTGLALLLPRLDQFHDARPVMMIHDEVIVECDRTEASEVALVVARSLEEGMNRWLKYTTATVEVEIVQDYAGTKLEENAQ